MLFLYLLGPEALLRPLACKWRLLSPGIPRSLDERWEEPDDSDMPTARTLEAIANREGA